MKILFLLQGDYWIMKTDEAIDLIKAITNNKSSLRNNIRVFRMGLDKLIETYLELSEFDEFSHLMEDFDLILFLFNIDEFDNQGDETGG
jgi:hypothetical protein